MELLKFEGHFIEVYSAVLHPNGRTTQSALIYGPNGDGCGACIVDIEYACIVAKAMDKVSKLVS
jgi:hypothetical protein